MANNLDAQIKLLYPTDAGSFFTADTVTLGQPFDVVANVEIGEDLMEVVVEENLLVAIRNLTQSTTIAQRSEKLPLTPQTTALNAERRVDFDPSWQNGASEGDLLEAIATYKVTAGVYTDYSSASSVRFVVTS